MTTEPCFLTADGSEQAWGEPDPYLDPVGLLLPLLQLGQVHPQHVRRLGRLRTSQNLQQGKWVMPFPRTERSKTKNDPSHGAL